MHASVYRLALAEKLRAPWRRTARRPDPASVAAREAQRLEAEGGTGAPLDFCVKMMFIGLAGARACACLSAYGFMCARVTLCTYAAVRARQI